MQHDAITKTLNELNQVSPDISGSLLAGTDGAALAMAMAASTQQDQLAAMFAGLSALGSEAAALCQFSTPEQTLVKSSDGYLLLTPVGTRGILGLALKPTAKPGLIMIDAQRAADLLLTFI